MKRQKKRKEITKEEEDKVKRQTKEEEISKWLGLCPHKLISRIIQKIPKEIEIKATYKSIKESGIIL